MVWTQKKQKILRRGRKNTQKNYTKKDLNDQITTMVWSPRVTHPRMRSQVGLKKYHYEQSQWRWWNSSWAISTPKRWCCESAAFNMPANLENSAVAPGLEKVNFYSNPKQRYCQKMFVLSQLHLFHMLSKYAQNSPSQASTVHEPWTSRCSSWI